MKKKRNLRRTVVRSVLGYGGFLIMLLLIHGCRGNRGYSQSPENRIKDLLEEKYGITVEINEMTEKPGMQAFQERYYLATAALVDTGGEFRVLLGKKSGVLKDDYPKLVYDSKIREIIDRIIEDYSDLAVGSYEINYGLSEGNWSQEDQLADYLADSDTEAGITVYADSISEEYARKIYSFAQALEEEGIHFTLKVEKESDTVYISSNRHSGLKTEDVIVNMLME